MTSWAVLGHFCHGLVFFTLALTVAFLHYRSRRILLARHLYWVGAFSLCEAIFAWNKLLSSLIPGMAFIPWELRPALLGVGYAFLLAFGLQTRIQKFDNRSAWTLLLAVNGIWLLPYLIVLMLESGSYHSYLMVEVWVRYALGLPGGVLTALGLRRQSYQTLEPPIRQRIRPYLQITEVMMLAFGALNAVLVPEEKFLLATYLNTQLLYPFPSGWLWVIVGTGLTFGLVRSLTTIQRRIEAWVEDVERLQALAVDRERIGRELHDGIIQAIYGANLLLESIMPVIPHSPERAQAQLGRVMENLNSTIQDIRRYIFNLRSDMADAPVPEGIAHLLKDFRVNTLLETELEINGEPVPIQSLERRRHIFQIVREALANTARHARAQWVKIQLDYGREDLQLTIADDGIGMETLQVSKGYGLRNIRERARMLDGNLSLETAPGEGVVFHLTVPYN